MRDTQPIGSDGERNAIPPIVIVASLTFVALNTIYLPFLYSFGEWIVGSDGRNRIADFVTLWSAGELVRDSHAAWAYD